MWTDFIALLTKMNGLILNHLTIVVSAITGFIVFMQYRMANLQRRDSLFEKRLEVYKDVIPLMDYLGKYGNFNFNFRYNIRDLKMLKIFDIQEKLRCLFNDQKINKIFKNIVNLKKEMENNTKETTFVKNLEDEYVNNFDFNNLINENTLEYPDYNVKIFEEKDVEKLKKYIKGIDVENLFNKYLLLEEPYEKALARSIVVFIYDLIKIITILYYIPKYFIQSVKEYMNINFILIKDRKTIFKEFLYSFCTLIGIIRSFIIAFLLIISFDFLHYNYIFIPVLTSCFLINYSYVYFSNYKKIKINTKNIN